MASICMVEGLTLFEKGYRTIAALALNMEIMINQALIDLLVDKGIITQEELMAKIEEIRQGLPKG
ncbi:MAG: hypothetical protein ACI8PB_003418 [Desulforhopalus sp.]|jgi:hypothetical protein